MGQKGIIVGHDLSTPVERSVETLSRQSYSRVYARSLWKGRGGVVCAAVEPCT
jgi:hypothetical protein